MVQRLPWTGRAGCPVRAASLPRTLCRQTKVREGDVLGVGIDWAEEFHVVALGHLGEGVIEVLRVEHRPQAVADLVVTFPAALAIAGEDLGATRILRLLERWPTAQSLATASREEIIEFGRAQRTGYLARFADKIAAALAEDHFTAPEHLVRAKAGTIRLTARQLLLIDTQRRAWEKRMGELLLGPHASQQEAGDQPGQAFPGGEIYLSFPGLGRRLAARIAGEIGEHIEQFTTPNSLQCYAGRAPVTRRSGKRDLVVAHRLACNRYLADAVHKWAFASLRRSAWAREFYDAQRARGKNHHAALRALGNRWLEVLWHCLTHDMPYDEAVHIANRNRALSSIAA